MVADAEYLREKAVAWGAFRKKLAEDAIGAKDYATADSIRAELQADGWTVETGPDGTTVRR